MESVYFCMVVLAAGTILTAIVCVPPWPMYHSQPIKYLPRIENVKLPKPSSTSWLF